MQEDVPRELISGSLSNVYRFKEFVRRNRILVTGIAAVLAILVMGVITSTFFASRAEHARVGAQAFADLLKNGIEALRLPGQVEGTEVSLYNLRIHPAIGDDDLRLQWTAEGIA